MVSGAKYHELNTSSDQLLSPTESDETKIDSASPGPCKHCGHDPSYPSSVKAKKSETDRLTTFALLLALVSLGLSVASSVYQHINPRVDPYSATGVRGKVLPRPNSYIGLERVQWPANASSIFKPIENWPLTTFQMRTRDSQGSRKLLPEQDRHHFTREGTVTPEDHRVTVDGEVNTIMQFRALDWGMENCILHLNPPMLPVPPHDHAGHDHEEEEPHSLKDGPDPPPGSVFQQAEIYANASIARGTTIDIFWLGDDPAREFLPHIYWGTAPPRMTKEKVKRVALTPGVSSGSYSFHCPSGNFPTFEFACAPSNEVEGGNDNCQADWWQEIDRGKTAGFYIEQQWSRN